MSPEKPKTNRITGKIRPGAEIDYGKSRKEDPDAMRAKPGEVRKANKGVKPAASFTISQRAEKGGLGDRSVNRDTSPAARAKARRRFRDLNK